MTLAEMIAQLRVARATGQQLPIEVLEAVTAELVAGQRRGSRRRDARRKLLRQAADLVPGSNSEKARRLRREILAGGRSLDELGSLVRQAIDLDPYVPIPASVRQLLRILKP
jgi:hypothetical protein